MTVSQNGDIIIWIVPITNNSSYTDTNVSTTNVFSAGQEYVSHTVTKGSYNTGTSLWTTGDMQGLTTETLTVRTRVTDILSAPFTLTSTVTGDLNGGDPTPYVQTVLLDSCPATGAGIDDISGCLCIDVSLNDTKCTKGVTTWELNIPSITNCTTYTWDEETGKGNFTPIDPTLPITGTYDLFCTSGMTVTQISCGVNFTITPQLEDKDIFDHTIAAVQYADLSVGDISVLTAQYPALVLADYYWNTIRNADGDLTSGIPVQCDEAADTRTFFSCTADACIADLGDCACSAVLPTDVTAGLPVDYEPQDGDTVYIQHPESTSIWVYDAANTRWERNACGCVYKISQAAGNLLTLNVLDNAPYISEDIILDATDEKVKVSLNDTTSGFLNGKLVAGTGITLTETNNGANETLVIAASAPPSTNVQVLDTCSVNMGITGTGTAPDPFIISATYNDGSVAPKFVTGVPGNINDTYNVSTLWGTACAAGCDTTYQIIEYSDNIFANVSITGSTLEYDVLDYSAAGVFQIIIQRSCGSTKTLSTLNVDIAAQPVSVHLSEYASVYKDTQTFTEGGGATKLDFGGTVLGSNLLTTSIINDNFVGLGYEYSWDVSYSGHLTFEIALASTQRVVIAAYLDGTIIPESRQIVVVPEGTSYQIPFSKSWIQQIPVGDTFDLRFDATLGDITALDTVLTLKQISYLI